MKPGAIPVLNRVRRSGHDPRASSYLQRVCCKARDLTSGEPCREEATSPQGLCPRHLLEHLAAARG